MANKGTPKPNDIEKGLLRKWKSTLTDDKGLFQGGQKKRLFGRFRDKMEDRFAGKKRFERDAIKVESGVPGAPPHPEGDSLSSSEANFTKKQKSQFSEDLREQDALTKKAGYNMYDKNRSDNPNFVPRVELANDDTEWEIPAYSEEFSYARDFALDFNVSDPKQVKELQRRLNIAGIKGGDGNVLKEDGVLGDNTMKALRDMQSQMLYENQYAKELLNKQIQANAQVNQIQLVQDKIKQDSIELEKNKALNKVYNTPVSGDPHDGNEIMGPDETFELGNDKDGYPA